MFVKLWGLDRSKEGSLLPITEERPPLTQQPDQSALVYHHGPRPIIHHARIPLRLDKVNLLKDPHFRYHPTTKKFRSIGQDLHVHVVACIDRLSVSTDRGDYHDDVRVLSASGYSGEIGDRDAGAWACCSVGLSCWAGGGWEFLASGKVVWHA